MCVGLSDFLAIRILRDERLDTTYNLESPPTLWLMPFSWVLAKQMALPVTVPAKIGGPDWHFIKEYPPSHPGIRVYKVYHSRPSWFLSADETNHAVWKTGAIKWYFRLIYIGHLDYQGRSMCVRSSRWTLCRFGWNGIRQIAEETLT